jgi:hypothetical protein
MHESERILCSTTQKGSGMNKSVIMVDGLRGASCGVSLVVSSSHVSYKE